MLPRVRLHPCVLWLHWPCQKTNTKISCSAMSMSDRSNDIKAVAEMNGVAPFGVCDLVGFRLGWAPLGLGWEHGWREGRTQWVTRKGEVHVSNSLYHANPFTGSLPWLELVAPPVHGCCWRSSLQAVFVQGFMCSSSSGIIWHRCPEEKIVYLPVWELKFSVYRQINLTKLANFRFHWDRGFTDDRSVYGGTMLVEDVLG